MSWSLNRQIAIFLLVTGFFALTGFILWFIYHPRPSCSDGLLNQNELAIDCGGVCLKVCPLIEVSDPVISWQQALLLSDHKYDLAALIENRNDKFGIEQLDYTFKVFGSGQVLLTTVTGRTYVNPNEKVVLYEPNVLLGENVPTRVVLEFATTTWQRQNDPAMIKLAVSEEHFTNTTAIPEAQAVIRNNSLETYRGIDVYIVLSDANRNVFAVSQTFIPVLGPNEVKNISFSWLEPFDMASTSETIIDIYPRFNTLKPAAF